MLVCPMENLEEELPLVDEADEETKGEVPSATPGTNGAGSATPRSCGGITNMPHSNDGAAAAGDIDATGSADKKSAASQSAASPAEEAPATDRSPSATDKTPSATDEKPSATCESPLATDEEPSATDEKPSATDRSPLATDEKPLATDGSPVEGPPVKVKKSRVKRIRKFFGRAIRTLFGKKKCQC